MNITLKYFNRINNEDKTMSLPLIKKLTQSFFIFSLTAITGLSHADDTEIYFNSSATSSTKPNVLLILDTSGSMTSNVTGTTQTRIEAMKEAMVDIITNTNDVNMGLMRFTYNDGGPILHEIRDLEESASSPSISATITSGNDDAEELVGGTAVVTGDPVLDVALTGDATSPISIRVSHNFDDADQRNSDVDNDTNDRVRIGATSGSRIDGVRFRGVNIPANGGGITTTIDSATVTLTEYGSNSGTATASVTVNDVDSSTAFADSDNYISTLDKSSAAAPPVTAITWNTLDGDATETSPDIKTHIQHLIDRAGWSAGNAITVLLETVVSGSSGSHSYTNHEEDPANAALLDVAFTTTATATSNLTGLRFQNINIPQGATITSATLNLKSSSTVTAAGTAELWKISAENDATGDSAAFTTADDNISDRTPTTGAGTGVVDWTVGNTATDDTITSPDISSVIQQVVKDNANWCGGNSITLFLAHSTGDQTRQFHSYESGDTPPVLNITYDPDTATGCFQATETAQISQSADDTEGSGTGGGTLNLTSGNTVGLRFQDIDVPQGATIISASIEFTARNDDSGNSLIDIWGEDVDDAASYGDVDTRTKTTKTVNWDTANWTEDQVYSTSTAETTPAVGLKEIVKEIVDRTNWASGNDMAFIFDATSDERRARSYNNNAQKAPRLSITYQGTGVTASTVTVRDNLVDIVNALPSNDWTPITEVLYESAHYWRGESVVYGKSRDGRSDTRISSASTYTGGTVNYPTGCTADNLDASACSSQSISGSPIYTSPFTSSLACQTNYQVLLTDGEANSNDIASTINTEFSIGGCQTLKSDGTAVTGGESCAIDLAKYMLETDQSSSISGDQTVKTYTVGFDTGGLANATQFLKDVAAAGGGEFFEAADKQGLIDQFNEILSDVKSDTTSFAAPSIAVNTFNRLFSRDEIYFGLFAPELETRWAGNLKKYSICVDADPDNDGTDDCTLGDVLDANSIDAVVSSTTAADIGLFKDSRQENGSGSVVAQSIWSAAPDGREIQEGGAGAEIGTTPDYTSRIIYTDVNNSGTAANGLDLEATGFKITATNWTGTDTNLGAVRNAVCGSSATIDSLSPDNCTATMEWMIGKDVLDEDNNTGTNTRWWFHDILHSSPNVITYGQDGSSNFIDKILVGTNNGSLHMVNGSNGLEDWSFIPNNMLGIQKTLYDNVTSDHEYGMDTTPILRVVDNNIDGTIDPIVTTANPIADFVHVYAGQRRGGNHYYALDITPDAALSSVTSIVTPDLLWRIDPVNSSDGIANCEFAPCAQGNFSRLGETWSEPAIAKIKVVDSSDVQIDGGKTVLIFGGGYDAGLDSLDDGVDIERSFGYEAGTPNDGNAIYIVDAATGKLIFWVGHAADGGTSPAITASGADIQVSDMNYAIPSNVTVVDSDGDGFDDRIYVGDTAGQVWRVDLGSNVKPSLTSGVSPNSATGPQGSTVVGKLAALSSLSTADTVANERRIFYRPSVSQVRDTEFSNAAGGEFDYILVTTGNRANPLNADTSGVKDVSDGLYALRDSQIGPMADAGTDNIADAYPQTITFNTTTGLTSALGTPIAISNLSPITLTTGLTGTASEKNSLGWYIDFDSTGTVAEKGLAAVRVFFGAVFLTTYIPDNSSTVVSACTASVGTGRIFNFNILNGRPALFWDGGDDSSYSADDVVSTLGAGGIAPEVVPVYTPDGVTILAGKENIGLAGENAAVETYWYQE
jgi:type IV pilus assembly protein PilY1